MRLLDRADYLLGYLYLQSSQDYRAEEALHLLNKAFLPIRSRPSMSCAYTEAKKCARPRE